MNRPHYILALTAGALFGCIPATLAQKADFARYVDPFIGTDPNPFTKSGYWWDTGNVFPGAVCPHGILAWSPDTTHNANIAGGYWYPDHTIEGFSLTHFSGRGVPCLKDIAFEPLVQSAGTSPGLAWTQYASSFSHQNESASPGYYRVKFDDGIETELTATPRTGMARFTFPSKAAATLLIRANGSVAINGNEVSGYADGRIPQSGQHYKVYFVAQFARPFKAAQTWVGDKIDTSPKADGARSGAILSFDTSSDKVVLVRVGISYTSLKNARDNLKQENSGWDFDGVKKSADSLWNHELSRVEIGGGTEAERRVFYTALYHCFIHPNYLEDANGQFLGMDQKVHTVEKGHHQYQNIDAWGSHNSLSPLIALLAPHDGSDIIQSLINYAQEDASIHPNGGGFPRWEQVNANSGGMAGDRDDTIIATSYAFGVRGFDAKAALEIMDKGASQPLLKSDGRTVREGLKDYLALGYVPGGASDTLEYCNADFSICQFARQLGDRDKYAAYFKRAQNWRNIFDPTSGYIRPRLADGTWKERFSPASDGGFREGTAAQYFWTVNFDLRGLIDLIGGNEKANERLDHFFTKLNVGRGGSEYAWMGNEPCEGVPWTYDFTGAPDRTQGLIRRIQTELFTDKPNGLPGNDDGGDISSWLVFSALGLYPFIPGVAGFVVGSPVFPKATIHLENGKSIQIIGDHATRANCYVQSMKINGQTHESPWIPWSMLSNGGVVDFDLGEKPSRWGTDPSKAPPSFDDVQPQVK